MALSQIHPHTEPQGPKGVTSFAPSAECQYSFNRSVQKHVSFCSDALHNIYPNPQTFPAL